MDSNYTPTTYFRDIVMLIALGMLLGIAFKRYHRIRTPLPSIEPSTLPLENPQETLAIESQTDAVQEPTPLPYPFEVHELDQAFLNQIHDALAQGSRLQQLAAQTIKLDRVATQRLDRILQAIREIKTNYSQNSPAVALLGPLGSTAIVIKEKKLTEQLLHEINRLGALLQEIKDQKNKTSTRFIESPYVKTALEFNNKILNEL